MFWKLPVPAQEHRAQSRTSRLSAHEAISPHPHWPEASDSVQVRIVVVLGEKPLEVHDKGTTSNSGLPSKDVTDTYLVMLDPLDEAAYVSPLEHAGFQLTISEPAWCGHRAFAAGGRQPSISTFGARTV